MNYLHNFNQIEVNLAIFYYTLTETQHTDTILIDK